MREITSHKVNGLNEGLKVVARGEPGLGGAYNRYHITTVETAPPIGGGMGEKSLDKAMAMANAVYDIKFQEGPIGEAGINGISNEVLLAIVMDRLHCFQAGPYACNENMHALVKLTEAMHWLQSRTMTRVARGVEGTHSV